MARSMLAGTNVAYRGDPLRDLTLTAFLDKFMQKKPKVSPMAAWHAGCFLELAAVHGGLCHAPMMLSCMT